MGSHSLDASRGATPFERHVAEGIVTAPINMSFASCVESARFVGLLEAQRVRSIAKRIGMRHLIRRFVIGAGVGFMARRKAALAVAVLTMSLALGANTAVFSVLNAFLLSSLAVPNPERVVSIAPVRTLPGRGSVVFADAYPNYRLLRESSLEAFSEVSCVFQGVASWDQSGDARTVQFSRVTASFFATIGVWPALGRAFSAAEEGPNPAHVVVLSHALWQGALGGDPAVIGRSLRINGAPHTVIGVMPRGFAHPVPTDIWLPFDVPALFWNSILGARSVAIFGRVADHRTLDSVDADLRAFTKLTIAANEKENRDYEYRAQPLRDLLLAGADSTVLLVQASAVSLLLLATLNLAALLIAWAFERRQEMAVRSSLGAPQGTIIRQLFGQSLVVVGLAGAIGCVFAYAAFPAVRWLNPNRSLEYFMSQLELDGTVLLGSASSCVLVALLAGMLPAWFGRLPHLAVELASTSRGATLSRAALRWQKLMVVAQAALSVAILSAAIVIGLSFRNLTRVPDGFEARDAVALRVQLPESEYRTHQQRAAFGVRLLENLGREPELAAYGFTTTLPVGDVQFGGRFFVEQADGTAGEEPLVFNYRRISWNYFSAITLPLLRGRSFEPRDDVSGVPVAIVSRSAARRLWPDEEAVGKRLYRPIPETGQMQQLEVIGVVADAMDAGYTAPPGETVYVPYTLASITRLSIVIRPRSSVEAAVSAVRRALSATDPVIAAGNVSPLDALVSQAQAMPRFQAALLLTFAVVAMGIVALGSYGAMAQLVANREREFAVRLAVGAVPAEIGRLVLRQMSMLVVPGIVAGVAGIWAAANVLRPFVFGIEPHSTGALAVSGISIAALVVLATLPSIRRVMRLDVVKSIAVS